MGLIPSFVHAEGLLPAHELAQPGAGIAALVVHLGPDPVDQVVLLLMDIVGQEALPPQSGGEEQFAQQGGGGLQDGIPLQGIGVIQKAGHKAYALGLALLADHRLDGAAIQLVQGGGRGPPDPDGRQCPGGAPRGSGRWRPRFPAPAASAWSALGNGSF